MSSATRNMYILLNGLHLLCTDVISCGSTVAMVSEKDLFLRVFHLIFSFQNLISAKMCMREREREIQKRISCLKERNLLIRSPNCILKEGHNTRIHEDKNIRYMSSFTPFSSYSQRSISAH